jgi:hypothetical protein
LPLAGTATGCAARELSVAVLLSLAAGYCAVAKRDGKQPAKANAEP